MNRRVEADAAASAVDGARHQVVTVASRRRRERSDQTSAIRLGDRMGSTSGGDDQDIQRPSPPRHRRLKGRWGLQIEA